MASSYTNPKEQEFFRWLGVEEICQQPELVIQRLKSGSAGFIHHFLQAPMIDGRSGFLSWMHRVAWLGGVPLMLCSKVWWNHTKWMQSSRFGSFCLASFQAVPGCPSKQHSGMGWRMAQVATVRLAQTPALDGRLWAFRGAKWRLVDGFRCFKARLC